jgi:hypothetical protein
VKRPNDPAPARETSKLTPRLSGAEPQSTTRSPRSVGASAALGILAVSYLPLACVTQTGTGSKEHLTDAEVTWDFEDVTESMPSPESPSQLRLWPPVPGAPGRIKRHLLTAQDGDVLQAKVNGIDPGFVWQFPQAVRHGSLRVELFSETPTSVQLFWAGEICRSFAENCSMHLPLPSGRSAVQALLPPEALRELRIDFEPRDGLRLDIHEITLAGSIIRDSVWHAPMDGTRTEATPRGLVVESEHGDPWIATDLPLSRASAFDTLTVSTEAPDGAGIQQLFWRGSECPSFSEECSLVLPEADGGLSALSVDLSKEPRWKGHLAGLRLDPGTTPGRYLVSRLTLSRRSPAAD